MLNDYYAMANVTVQEVRDLVLDRLVSGVYPYSTKLPTARELAQETGAHRNTVAKAYQALADIGLVTLKQGRGTYVTGVVDEQNRTSLLDQIRDVATELIHKSRRLGIAKEDLQKILNDEIAEQYGSSMLRAAFLECNPDDTSAGVEEIELLTGYRVAPLLLSTLQEDTETTLKQYDVIITSLFHVNDVNRILDRYNVQGNHNSAHNGDYGPVDEQLGVLDGPVGEQSYPDGGVNNARSEQAGPGVLDRRAHHVKIVGVYTHPDEHALGEIAQIRTDAHAAVIVSNQEGGRRLDLHVRTIGPTTTTLLVKPDDKTILDCVDKVDVFVCSRSMAPQVRALQPDKPLIVLPFHISQQSAAKIIDGLVGSQSVPTG